ncbi:hypothetical protein AB0395_43960 [Streptosporangium sp. NPDC051023]|uniref:hypothetical protein n=1 Tax=Streptosporangium sp. NPDC051023 TaxID=3155410 RepID=UPI003450930F
MSRRSPRPAGMRASLLGAVVVSALAWWLLNLTPLLAPAAAWLAGLAAGLSCLSVLAAARRTVAASLQTTTPRPRRTTKRGAR